MKPKKFFAYVAVIFLLTGGAIWYIISDYYARQSTKTQIVMYKNEGCQCCDKWANYMQHNGYLVKAVSTENLNDIKREQNVPRNMEACHTALAGNFIIEGHVPAEDIKRLLREKPDARGLFVPGMPASSPGMNTALNQPFNVYLVKDDGSTEIYAQH